MNPTLTDGSGKVRNADRSGAVSPEQVSPSERREALQKILASPLFRRSFRLRRFLDDVVEKSVEDDGASLTEQQIDVAFFERWPSYDTSADNIVRVNATELRKRLELFTRARGRTRPSSLISPREVTGRSFCAVLSPKIQPPRSTHQPLRQLQLTPSSRLHTSPQRRLNGHDPCPRT